MEEKYENFIYKNLQSFSTKKKMSSLRNAMKRRTHKERAQPAKRRKRFGLLEKHKDYVERAKNYRQKRGRIRVLKEKATSRNPDEFYFGMVHSKTTGGVFDASTAGSDGAKLQAATMKLMRTQDASYVRMKRSVEQNKIERLSNGLHFLHGSGKSESGGSESGGARPNKHTIFVDSKEEVDAFDAAKHFQTLPEYVHRTFNRPRLEAKKKKKSEEEEREEESEEEREEESEEESEEEVRTTLVVHGDLDYKSVKRMRKKRDRGYQELGERLDREEMLR